MILALESKRFPSIILIDISDPLQIQAIADVRKCLAAHHLAVTEHGLQHIGATIEVLRFLIHFILYANTAVLLVVKDNTQTLEALLEMVCVGFRVFEDINLLVL